MELRTGMDRSVPESGFADDKAGNASTVAPQASAWDT